MKSNLFTEVLETETVKLDCNLKDAIDRLRQFPMFSNKRDATGYELAFFCNKRGRFSIQRHSRSPRTRHGEDLPRNYIMGKLFQVNGETFAEINCVRNRFSGCFMPFSLISELILLIFCIITGFKTSSTFLLLEVILLGGFTVFNLFYIFFSDRNYEDENLDMMKQQMLDKLKAVERWND